MFLNVIQVENMKHISEKEFLQLTEYIKSRYGINLLQKKHLVVGRLQNYLIQNNFKSFSEYYEYIVSGKDEGAVITLINKLTTNHTFFMREPEHFRYFNDIVLPYLESTVEDRDLRIWSAGCSSGEEPYTLSMILFDFFGREKGIWDTKILATDISSRVLEIAVSGVYPNEKIEALPSMWRLNYFKKIDNLSSVIDDRIKNNVIFRKLNLMETSFPFRKKFHVIFCRNVMIYFDNNTKDELINKFYNMTEPGGYLFIGHSESLNRGLTRYKYVAPAIYRKE